MIPPLLIVLFSMKPYLLKLAPVAPEHLPFFFKHQQDKTAIHMAAFTPQDPFDRRAFDAHWEKIMNDERIIIQSIIVDDHVAGHVLSYELEDTPELSYWLDRAYWGRGIATAALQDFLSHINTTRPMYARVASDNIASIKVLQKCGFVKTGEFTGYANARGKEIAELVMQLTK